MRDWKPKQKYVASAAYKVPAVGELRARKLSKILIQ